MKKIVHFTLVFLAGISVALSCSKVGAVDAIDGENAAPAGKQIIIHATLADALTRVAYTLDESGDKPKLTLEWERSDVLVVSNTTSSVEIGNPTIDATGKTATFSGTLPEGGEPYTVVVQHAGANLGATQTQTADGDLKHLEYAAMAENVTEADFANLALTQTTGVLGLIAKIPTVVSAAVKAVIFQTESNLFNGSNTLTVNLGTAGAGVDNILYVYANVAAASIPADTKMFIRFKVGDGANDYYTRYQVFTSDVSLNTGALNGLKLNCSHIDRYAGKDDKGTAAAPYLIADKYQMKAMRSQMNLDETTFFNLIDNIDLEDEAWTPLNPNEGFKRGIFLDGNNHTVYNLTPDNELGYPSFVGVLNGTIKNLTIDGVTINAGSNKAGAIGGYIGTSGIIGKCENVTVKNISIVGTNYLGGFAGQVGNAGDVFENCHVIDATITQRYGTANTERSTGGFIGHASTAASYRGCTVKATVKQDQGKTINSVGGFIGKADGASSFSNCQVLEGSSVTGHSYVGGFVGYNTKASTYDNCTTAATVSGDGEVIGGFVGNAINGNFGDASPCIASGNVSGTSNESYYIGGFVGLTSATSYRGCSYQGSSVSSNAETEGKSALVGGFCGRSAGVEADSFVDCFVYNSTSGTTISAKLQRAGGFMGQSGSGNSTNLGTISGCYVNNVTLSLTDKNCGGFIGVAYVPMTNCYVEGGSIKAAGASTGGFAGHLEKVNLTGCHSTMTVDANGKSDVGGLVGYVATALKISNCYYDGSITASGQAIGGIVGRTAHVEAIIENCYSKGSLTTTAGVQIHGGIIGEMGKGGIVRNCYSTMTVTGGRVLGGIVGRAAGGGWNYETETDNTISKCIAFNPAITATQTGTYGSSGPIVGVTSIKNVLEDCYRLSNMSFVNSNNWGNTLINQVNSDGTNWTRDSSTGTGPGNQCAYFGVAAAADAKVSSIAQTLGWSGDVWDFTGDLPVLK
jgi:hypothetical protein